MADDIKIRGINDQPNQQNVPQTGGQAAGGQSAGAPTAGTQATGGQTGTHEEPLNPVIDLRNIDQKQEQAAPVAAPSPRRSNAIMLGEDENAPQPQPPQQEKYAIPSMVNEKFPDLIQLIKETESMNDEERDYWFQILPIMTEDQIRKFRDILVNEKSQLTSLDQEYEQELQKLNEKHMIEWKEFETKEKRKSLTSAEKVSKDEEKAQEEELLKRLSQV